MNLKIFFTFFILKSFEFSMPVNSSILSSVTDCQSPSEHYLKIQLDFYINKFNKSSDSVIQKYYGNLILKSHWKEHELKKQDIYMSNVQENYIEEVNIIRFDKYPFEMKIFYCKAEYYYDPEGKFLKCQNQYKLTPILARGLCDVKKMQWEWNFNFENRSISCICL